MSQPTASWGGYPAIQHKLNQCVWRSDIVRQIKTTSEVHGTTLPFGNGRSYGDSCLAASHHALGMNTLNRFIAVDWEQGLVTAEAGVTLADILRIAIPNGWFLAVTPGTQFVTLGGAIANDVHGKNHHVRGTFGCHVEQFGLLREEQILNCSAQDNPQLFSATIGGLGLTGVITWAQIRLIPIQSAQIDCRTVRFNSLDEFFTLSNSLDTQHEYSVAWIDCLATGKQTGRGVFMVGDHAQYGDFQHKSVSKLSVPLTPPMSLINSYSLRAFNHVYWHKHPKQLTISRSDYEPFFYPLDGILHWNRIYGRKGFQQYQCVIPEEQAADAIKELLQCIARSGRGSFLAVLKRCGDIASPGLLSFPMAGTSLALDFAHDAQLETELFQTLDNIVHSAGGRLYPAKDAHMRAIDFQTAYPNWQRLEQLRDPTMQSLFWQRVTQ